jgi:hypothetical protein
MRILIYNHQAMRVQLSASTILFGDNECETPSVDYNVWLQFKGSKHTYRIYRIIV